MPVASSNSTQPVGPSNAEEPTLHVELSENGDATVTLVSVYTLTESSDRNSFESIRADEQTRSEMLERFADRLETVSTEIDSDGNDSITGAEANLRSSGDRGIVSLSVTWDSLATDDGETLVVDEPFASGFEADRTLVVVGPEGSTLESSTPEPTATDGERAVWETKTDLDGFEAAFTPPSEESSGGDDESDATPGFGGAVAVVSIVVLLEHRRRY